MTKIYTDDGKEIKNTEDWRSQLSEGNWEEGKSAYELAHSWLDSAEGMPQSVYNLLNSSDIFKNLIIEKAIVEKKVYFDNLERPSQTDLMIYGKSDKGKIVIAVEGKETEKFGDKVSDWFKEYDKEESNKELRLKGLLSRLNLINLEDINIGKIRYQLLHRTVSALIEADKYNAKYAMMLVHSFSNLDDKDHFDDYKYFCSLLGLETIDRNKIVGLVTINNINLYFGWLRDKKKGC